MNCNFTTNSNCGCCKNFVNTTSVTFSSPYLILTIPNVEITNCKTLCIHLAQEIPSGVTSSTIVAVNVNGGTYTIVSPCCGNYVYADQLTNCKTYCFKFATDTKCLVYKSGWRLKCTNHVFPSIPIPIAPAVVETQYEALQKEVTNNVR